MKNITCVPIQGENPIGLCVLFNIDSEKVEEHMWAKKEQMEPIINEGEQILNALLQWSIQCKLSAINLAFINGSNECKVFLNKKLQIQVFSPQTPMYIEDPFIGKDVKPILQKMSPEIVKWIGQKF